MNKEWCLNCFDMREKDSIGDCLYCQALMTAEKEERNHLAIKIREVFREGFVLGYAAKEKEKDA